MNYWDQKLLREQLDKKLVAWKEVAKPENRIKTWVKSLRLSLGMTLQDLADKMQTDRARISRIEKAELEGDLRISTFKKVAEVLDMEFVYGFLPKETLQSKVENQARKIAVNTLNQANYSMKLEDQEVLGEDIERMLDDLKMQILMDPPIDFWKK